MRHCNVTAVFIGAAFLALRSRATDEDFVASSSAQSAPLQATNAGQNWNFHAQSTFIVQGDPGFPAKYSGPNSLNSKGEVQETVTLDLFAVVRVWRRAEAPMDAFMLQCLGFGR